MNNSLKIEIKNRFNDWKKSTENYIIMITNQENNHFINNTNNNENINNNLNENNEIIEHTIGHKQQQLESYNNYIENDPSSIEAIP